MQDLRSGPDGIVSNRMDTLQTRIHILRGSRLFADLPSDALEALALSMKQRQAAPGEAIFVRTDEGSALFGILEGQVRIVIVGIDGGEQVLRVLGPGEMFGEIATLDGRQRSADDPLRKAA
jgi:CRP/FNR family transcriptional regulator, cyclic AMP receptor protein